MKLAVVIWLILIAAGVYTAVAFGTVYWHKYKVGDAVQRDLAFAGQLTNDAIREQLVKDISAMSLPREARRVRLVQTGPPRALQVTISYVDTVNLLVVQKPIPVKIEARRVF